MKTKSKSKTDGMNGIETLEHMLSLSPQAYVPSKRAAVAKVIARRKRGEIRVRFDKPPEKKVGNPFVAVRMRKELLSAFKALAKKQKLSTSELMRAMISKATGVPVGDDDGGADE